MKQELISTYTIENKTLFFEKSTNFFTKNIRLKVYLQKDLFIKIVTKEKNCTKTIIKDNPNPSKKEFLYEIKGKQSDVLNFIKLIKNDFKKQSKQYNYTSILYY